MDMKSLSCKMLTLQLSDFLWESFSKALRNFPTKNHKRVLPNLHFEMVSLGSDWLTAVCMTSSHPIRGRAANAFAACPLGVWSAN